MAAQGIYQQRLRVIRLDTASQLERLWDRLDDHGLDQAPSFARRASSLVARGQMRAAQLTNGYVARKASVKPLSLTPAAVVGTASRRVDPLIEYERPFHVVDEALSQGVDPTTARSRGLVRLTTLVVTDVWLASRTTSGLLQEANSKITGWLRVADLTACEECAAADGMTTAEASQIAGHPGCGCTSEPTFSDSPPSEAADPEAVAIHEHGEMGAVLTSAGDKFAE